MTPEELRRCERVLIQLGDVALIPTSADSAAGLDDTSARFVPATNIAPPFKHKNDNPVTLLVLSDAMATIFDSAKTAEPGTNIFFKDAKEIDEDPGVNDGTKVWLFTCQDANDILDFFALPVAAPPGWTDWLRSWAPSHGLQLSCVLVHQGVLGSVDLVSWCC